jgi:hypothetical protein
VAWNPDFSCAVNADISPTRAYPDVTLITGARPDVVFAIPFTIESIHIGTILKLVAVYPNIINVGRFVIILSIYLGGRGVTEPEKNQAP